MSEENVLKTVAQSIVGEDKWRDHCNTAVSVDVLYNRLQRFAIDYVDGRAPRLAVRAPVRSGKTTAVTTALPVVLNTVDNYISVVVASYNVSMAEFHARRINTIVKEEVADFCSIGGTTNSKRFDLVIIDEPSQNLKDASNGHNQMQKYRWYNHQLRTRLNKNAGIIIVESGWDTWVPGLIDRVMYNSMDVWEMISIPEITPEDSVHRS